MEIFVILEYMLDEPADIVGCFSQEKDAQKYCDELNKYNKLNYYVQSRPLNDLTTINKINEHYNKEK